LENVVFMENSQKESTMAEQAKQGKKTTGFPVELAILLVVFGIVAGIAINQYFLQKPAQLPDGAANKGTFEEIKVELKTIYNSDCNICYRQSNIETLLQQQKTKFAAEYLDMKAVENGVLAGNYGMSSFPSSLLNWKQLKVANPKLFKDLNQLFETNGDYFVIPEADLIKEMQAFAPIIFMDPQFGELCGVKKGTVRIDEFGDYFSDYAKEMQSVMDGIKKDFNANLEYHYRSFPLANQSGTAAIATECARQQNKLEEFKKALFTAFFDQGRDISDKNELEKIAAEQNIPDLPAFNQCLEKNESIATVEKDLLAAKQYKFFTVPSVVIDCIYATIETDDLKQQICSIHPADFNACKS